jgi:hypothetical protein
MSIKEDINNEIREFNFALNMVKQECEWAKGTPGYLTLICKKLFDLGIEYGKAYKNNEQ